MITTSSWVYIGDLTSRHQAALRLFVDKFRRGAQQHGDLKPGKKWTVDKLEETIDLNFYAIFELLDLIEGEKE